MVSTFIHKIVPLKPPKKNAAEPLYKGKLILFGEDDPDDEELLREVFSGIDSSFVLVFRDNGKKILNTFNELKEEELPCLIVLDYNMPELNGAEILEKLNGHSRASTIPKIIWSTSGSEIYKKICLEMGACDYIKKPSNVTELEKSARYMLSFCTVDK